MPEPSGAGVASVGDGGEQTGKLVADRQAGVAPSNTTPPSVGAGMKPVDQQAPLARLARAHGLLTKYVDGLGEERHASIETLLAMLEALGAPVARPDDAGDALRQKIARDARRALPDVSVIDDGNPAAIYLRLCEADRDRHLDVSIELEGSGPVDARAARVPPGWPAASAAPSPECLRFGINAAELAPRAVTEVDGDRFFDLEIRLPWPQGPGDAALPWGYHRLHVDLGPREHRGHLFVGPRQAYRPEDARSWGVFAPIHALRSSDDLGIGDYGSLSRLIAWAGSKGAGVFATLPACATFLDEPCEPSPYAPVSRQFFSEVLLDIAALPELAASPAARRLLSRTDVQREIETLRGLPLVDYRRQIVVKRQILRELARTFFAGEHRQKLVRFLANQPHAFEYARFRAIHETRQEPWSEWPEAWRRGDLPEAWSLAGEEEAFQYHLYVQFRAAEQIDAASAAARGHGPGLYLDLPVGVHPEGYDAWRWQDDFLGGCSAGAPPDMLFTAGQNWGFRPMHPERSLAGGYRSMIESIGQQMRRAGVLRVDHVMGLHRILCIPDGMAAADGVYVTFAHAPLYAALCLESHRNHCLLVGEDLGTVPDACRDAMDGHGLSRMYLLPFESSPDGAWPFDPPTSRFVASLNTHDTPPFSGFIAGADIDQRVAMGLLDEAAAHHEHAARRNAVQALRDFVGRRRFDGARDDRALLLGLLEELAISDAQIVLISLEDLWLETEPQNVPGTHRERPNWRRKMLHSLEELPLLPGVAPLIEAMTKLRAESRALTPTTHENLDRFHRGDDLAPQDLLGGHLTEEDGVHGARFAVWAPNAEAVSVIGSFNDWQPGQTPLTNRGHSGIWSGFVAGASNGDLYKLHIRKRHGAGTVDKADPYGFRHELPPRTASVLWDDGYRFADAEWMDERKAHQALDAPMSIYEVHLGSFRRVPEEGNRMLSYRELAPLVADHALGLGFTHVELLPIMEHPFYGSWGYQVTGYYAPTSRHGGPQDLKYFVDYLHQRGLGVILDWVPGHFPTDAHGLGAFDGTHLYEHADPRQGMHPDWNTHVFNYGRREVQSFLIGNALYWLDRYHFDGLRVDGVASMLYLDYSRKEGEWLPNQYGGRENLEAVAFLKRLNEEVYARHPGVQTIAEESTAWPMVSRPTSSGGLGFGLKWDMGWMHDTLAYMEREPVHRSHHHGELIFRQHYAYTENYILPLSHDEVVHGKGSLLDRMPGDPWQRFANLRLLYAYMWALPGKKLLFMGQEFAQGAEWSHDASLDWHLLDREAHRGVRDLVAALNHLYRSERALHELDVEHTGFSWLVMDDHAQSVLAFERVSQNEDERIIALFNFTPVPRDNYRVGVSEAGTYRVIFNSDAPCFGGSGLALPETVAAQPVACHGRGASVAMTIPPLGALFLRLERRT